MRRTFRALGERWPLTKPFRISRGVRKEAEVVVVEVTEGETAGRGEGVPIARYGESIERCLQQLQLVADRVGAGLTRRELQSTMPAGAARNALDCALWDLELRLAGRPVNLLGDWRESSGAPACKVQGHADTPREPDNGRRRPRITQSRRVTTAITVGLDSPERMAAAAAQFASYPLVKVKVSGTDSAAQLRAVREACPNAALIVDPNESWDARVLESMRPHLSECRVALLEQPLPAGEDRALTDVGCDVPVCADESCHTEADLARILGRYQYINIKLDKTGGLTSALDLLAAARAAKLGVMTGCMVCTSLSIAPAFQIAEQSDFVDLDGPLWLSRDRDGGVTIDGGVLTAPSAALWGGPPSAGTGATPAPRR